MESGTPGKRNPSLNLSAINLHRNIEILHNAIIGFFTQFLIIRWKTRLGSLVITIQTLESLGWLINFIMPTLCPSSHLEEPSLILDTKVVKTFLRRIFGHMLSPRFLSHGHDRFLDSWWCPSTCYLMLSSTQGPSRGRSSKNGPSPPELLERLFTHHDD